MSHMHNMPGMNMPESGGHSHHGMGSMMHMGHMSMQDMAMTFFAANNTPLFSMAWTPENNGQYAGTCIFLIALSVILRGLYAFKTIMEAKWLQKAFKRRYVVVTPDSSSDEGASVTPTTKDPNVTTSKTTATLTTNGLTERVKLVQKDSLVMGATWRQPWRLSVDLPRALIVTVMVGVGYLLMLAVMTMNVGYFLSVLAGAFVGELFFGRYARHVENHH